MKEKAAEFVAGGADLYQADTADPPTPPRHR
jgi:hypothetical protein